MAAIYGNAYVVFAAHGPDLGLVKEINSCTEKGHATGTINAGDSAVFVRQTIDHDNLVHRSDDYDSWFGRAWCFQERLFASRILHFGGKSEEIFFECNVHLRCECGEVKNLSQSNSGASWNHQKASFSRTIEASQLRATNEEIEFKWRAYVSLCEIFTSQGLTYPQDTLLALSSLAERVSPQLGRYLAGLWEHNLLIGLQWESLNGQLSHRQTTYIAPSSSWASRTGSAVWYIADEYLTPNFEKCEFAQVLDWHCETSPEAPYGRVTDGYIVVRGYTNLAYFEDTNGCYIQGRLKILKRNSSSMDGTETVDDSTRRREHCFVCMDAAEDIPKVRGKEVVCLDIMRDKSSEGFLSALILMEVADRLGAYRRVGFSTMKKDFFNGVHLRDIMII